MNVFKKKPLSNPYLATIGIISVKILFELLLLKILDLQKKTDFKGFDKNDILHEA